MKVEIAGKVRAVPLRSSLAELRIVPSATVKDIDMDALDSFMKAQGRLRRVLGRWERGWPRMRRGMRGFNGTEREFTDEVESQTLEGS